MSEPPVVNASPLIYLAHAGFLDLLQLAGETILIPSPVSEEIRRRGSSDPTVRALEAASWLKVVAPIEAHPRITSWNLGPGETAVLAWAQAHPGCMAILDDLAGRRCAEVLEIPLIGTLGLVLRAKRVGRISAARPVLSRLRETGMYLSASVMEPALRLVGE